MAAGPWALPLSRPLARYIPETSAGSYTGSIIQKQSFPAADWRQGSLGFISLLSTASFTKTKPSWESEPLWLASPCHLGLTIHHYFQSRLLWVCSRQLPRALCRMYFEPFVVGHTLLTGISFGSPFCRLQPSSRLPVCSSDGLPGMDGRAEELGPHSRDGFRAFSDLPSGTSLWPPPLPLARKSVWVNMTSDTFWSQEKGGCGHQDWADERGRPAGCPPRCKNLSRTDRGSPSPCLWEQADLPS